jgi:hypothetical protein
MPRLMSGRGDRIDTTGPPAKIRHFTAGVGLQATPGAGSSADSGPSGQTSTTAMGYTAGLVLDIAVPGILSIAWGADDG